MRYTFLIIFFLLGQGCSSEEKKAVVDNTTDSNNISLTPEQVASAGIVTDSIRKQLISSELVVNGVVDVPPQNMVSVSFPLGGYLKTTKLLPGMQVRKGEVIAIMEDQALIQLQQDFLVAKARLHFLEKDYDRQKLLNTEKVNADKVLQQSQADYLSQKVLVRGYSEKLRLTGINPDRLNENTISRSVPLLSPITGFVSKVNVNIGRYVNPSDVLFELINPDDIHAALTVFEKDLTSVRPGQRVAVSFVDDPTAVYECEVLLITKNVDNNRAALVHCHFINQPKQLLPGMFLNARIKISNAELLAVPEEAIVRFGSAEYILLLKGNNQYELTMVKTGVKEKGRVVINNDSISLEGRQLIVNNAYAVLAMIKNAGSE